MQNVQFTVTDAQFLTHEMICAASHYGNRPLHSHPTQICHAMFQCPTPLCRALDLSSIPPCPCLPLSTLTLHHPIQDPYAASGGAPDKEVSPFDCNYSPQTGPPHPALPPIKTHALPSPPGAAYSAWMVHPMARRRPSLSTPPHPPVTPPCLAPLHPSSSRPLRTRTQR